VDLNSLRRYAIRKGVRVRFQAHPSGECLVNEHGVVKMPALKGAPDFTVGSLLESAEHFTVEAAGNPPKRQKLSRAQLESLLTEAPQGEPAGEE
jgi:hypothetical protein